MAPADNYSLSKLETRGGYRHHQGMRPVTRSLHERGFGPGTFLSITAKVQLASSYLYVLPKAGIREQIRGRILRMWLP